MGDLVERLRTLCNSLRKMECPHGSAEIAFEAADELTALRADRDRHKHFSEQRFIEMTEALEREHTLREQVAALEEALADAREKLVWSLHYMIEPESHPTIKRIDAILSGPQQGGGE